MNPFIRRQGHLFARGPSSQTLAGTIVQKRVVVLKFRPANSNEGGLLGIELADQTVRILVRTPLSGVIGIG